MKLFDKYIYICIYIYIIYSVSLVLQNFINGTSSCIAVRFTSTRESRKHSQRFLFALGEWQEWPASAAIKMSLWLTLREVAAACKPDFDMAVAFPIRFTCRYWINITRFAFSFGTPFSFLYLQMLLLETTCGLLRRIKTRNRMFTSARLLQLEQKAQ